MYRIFTKKTIPQKIQLSIAMSIYAGVLAFWFPVNVRLICFLAMSISTLGDFFLNHKVMEKRTKKDFALGTISFMLAHLIYMAAFLGEIKKYGYKYWNIGAYLAIAILIITTIYIFTMMAILKRKTSKSFIILCLVYILFIGMNFTTILSFAFSIRSIKSLVALGAISFFISDMFIGIENLLKVNNKTLRKLVWWFYPLGQILILTFA